MVSGLSNNLRLELQFRPFKKHSPLFHADYFVPGEAPHLQLAVQIPDREGDQLLVGNSALDEVG